VGFQAPSGSSRPKYASGHKDVGEGGELERLQERRAEEEMAQIKKESKAAIEKYKEERDEREKEY
jgi:hypothetical protein